MGGGGACWLPVWAWVACVFLALRAAIGVLWVRGFLPPFFVAAGVPLGWGEAKGGGVGRVFGFFFCVKGVVSGGCEVACEW